MLINKIRAKQTVLPLAVEVEAKILETSRSPASTVSHSRSNSPSPPPQRVSPIHVESTPVAAAPLVVSKSAVISRAPEYYNPEDVGSDTEDETEKPPDPTPEILIPDQELKLIIDKLVLYVAKNGRDFEIVVKRKCDPRFSFLEPGDKHNPYYESELSKLLPADGAQQTESTINSTDADNSQKQSLLRFSIKKPRPDKPIIASADTKVKSALEDSSSDEDTESTSNNNPSPPPPPVISEPLLDAPPPPNISGEQVPDRAKIVNGSGVNSQSGGVISPSSGAISQSSGAASQISGTMSQSSGAAETDEKKAERKRRAELFLKMLQKTGELSASDNTTTSGTAPVEDTDEIQHIETVKKIEKKAPVPVYNVIDSDDESPGIFNGITRPLDLKAKLKALRTQSRSPVSRSAAPPSKIRKSSHHSRHRRGKSRSLSSSSSDHAVTKRSRGHKKSHRHHRDASLSPSPERSRKHAKKSSKSAKKKKKQREESRSPTKLSSRKSKSSRRKKDRGSESRSPSPSPKRSKSSKSKRKKRKSRSSESD